MEIPVGITLTNNRNEYCTVRIPAGQIFESTQADYGVQNVAVEREYKFTLRPYEKLKVIVYGRCLNSARKEPKDILGRATPFRYAGDLDQSTIWKEVSKPKK